MEHVSEPYQALAQNNLDQAVQELRLIPNGQVRIDELAARSAKAQAIATIALSQAVLHLADTLSSPQTEIRMDTE